MMGSSQIRTWMYVPADSRRKLDRSLTSGADAVLADLEDAVSASGKAAARESLAAWLHGLDPRASHPHIWVRVNSDSVSDDVAAALHPLVEGICLPKVESPDEIAAVGAVLNHLEPEGTAPLPLMLMVETAQGVLRCREYAAVSERVMLFQLGEQDLRADLGLPPDLAKGAGPLPGPLQAARDAVVIASAAAGLAGPVAPVSVNIHDAQLLTEETARLRHAGFSGRALIHPAQVAPVNRGFAPTQDEIDWARSVVEAADAAGAEGTGVTVVDGGMVDAPVVATARQLLGRVG